MADKNWKMGEGQMPAENIADKTLSDTAQESPGDIIEDLLPESAGDHADNKEDALPESAGSHVDNKEDMLSGIRR